MMDDGVIFLDIQVQSWIRTLDALRQYHRQCSNDAVVEALTMAIAVMGKMPTRPVPINKS